MSRLPHNLRTCITVGEIGLLAGGVRANACHQSAAFITVVLPTVVPFCVTHFSPLKRREVARHKTARQMNATSSHA